MPPRTLRPVYLDRLPPCNHACPAGENIQAWLATRRRAATERRGELLVRDNPFPPIHGRVCYHPCEDACNRGKLDEAVASTRSSGSSAIWRSSRAGRSARRRPHRQAGAGRRRRAERAVGRLPPGAARPRGRDPRRRGRSPAG